MIVFVGFYWGGRDHECICLYFLRIDLCAPSGRPCGARYYHRLTWTSIGLLLEGQMPRVHLSALPPHFLKKQMHWFASTGGADATSASAHDSPASNCVLHSLPCKSLELETVTPVEHEFSKDLDEQHCESFRWFLRMCWQVVLVTAMAIYK